MPDSVLDLELIRHSNCQLTAKTENIFVYIAIRVTYKLRSLRALMHILEVPVDESPL